MTPYNYTYQQQPFQPTNRVRSGRTQQAVADEIQVLENTPLPAGGNPPLAGVVTLAATAAVTTGVSEGAYRWGLDTKLAHAKNGTETPADPLTPERKDEIRASVETEKLDVVNKAKVEEYFTKNQEEIQRIVPDAITVEDAIDKQKAKIDDLKTTQQGELSTLNTQKQQALKAIVAPATSGVLTEAEINTKVSALNVAKHTGFDAWAKELNDLTTAKTTADNALKVAEDAFTNAKNAKNTKILQIGQDVIQNLERKAFGYQVPLKPESYWGGGITLQRNSRIEQAKKWHLDAGRTFLESDFYSVALDQPKYIEWLEHKINERKFKEVHKLKRPLNDSQKQMFEDWKKINESSLPDPTNLTQIYKADTDLDILNRAIENTMQTEQKAFNALTEAQRNIQTHWEVDKNKGDI